MEKLYTSKELAELLRVTQRTLQRWREEQRIPYIELPNGRYRYRESDIVSVMNGGLR